MRPVRLGLVGFGAWGRNYVRAARESGEAEVTCLVLREDSPNWKNPFTEEFHRATHMAAVADSVDAFVIAGHPCAAEPRCRVALEAARPVLVEKPAGLSLIEAQMIAATEREHRGLVLVGHQHLFAAGFEELLAVLRDDVADILVASMGPVRREHVSPLWDYGPHAIAMALALLGGGEVDFGGATAVDRWGAHIVHQGRAANVAIGNRDERAACATLFWKDETRVRYDAYASRAEAPLTRQVRAFAQAVRAGGTADWRFGARWAVSVATALEQIAKSGAA